MSNVANYSVVAMPGRNNMVKVDKDQDGYRKMILGGFNIHNSINQYYPITDRVKSLFAKGGALRRKVDLGTLRGEYGHPDITTIPPNVLLNRIGRIEEKNISHHIKELTLEKVKDEKNKDVILVYGVLKPCGPLATALEASLNNKEENVFFSIRSFSRKSWVNGEEVVGVTGIVTWDYVNHGGIALANKYDTAKVTSYQLENIIDDYNFTDVEFNEAIVNSKAVGMESCNTELTMIKDSMGWNKVEVIKGSSMFI